MSLIVCLIISAFFNGFTAQGFFYGFGIWLLLTIICTWINALWE